MMPWDETMNDLVVFVRVGFKGESGAQLSTLHSSGPRRSSRRVVASEAHSPRHFILLLLQFIHVRRREDDDGEEAGGGGGGEEGEEGGGDGGPLPPAAPPIWPCTYVKEAAAEATLLLPACLLHCFC
jgi:hypothetical protein